MGLGLGGYTFEGPYADVMGLQNRSGVYAILCENQGQHTVIDIGESADVRTRVESHDRRDCWTSNCSGRLMAAVLYTPNAQQAGRVEIEQELRGLLKQPCDETEGEEQDFG